MDTRKDHWKINYNSPEKLTDRSAVFILKSNKIPRWRLAIYFLAMVNSFELPLKVASSTACFALSVKFYRRTMQTLRMRKSRTVLFKILLIQTRKVVHQWVKTPSPIGESYTSTSCHFAESSSLRTPLGFEDYPRHSCTLSSFVCASFSVQFKQCITLFLHFCQTSLFDEFFLLNTAVHHHHRSELSRLWRAYAAEGSALYQIYAEHGEVRVQSGLIMTENSVIR